MQEYDIELVRHNWKCMNNNITKKSISTNTKEISK